MSETTHISSLLLRADPDKLKSVLNQIALVPNSEVPLSDASGKIVVVLETETEGAIISSLNELEVIEGVVSASLIYHQTD